jgi:folate-binding protein YgfZ
MRYAALLSPQGKILFDFLLSGNDDALYIDCAADAAETLAKRLTMYRLRTPVEISLRRDLAVVWTPDANAAATFAGDPRHPGLGARAILPSADASPGAASYRARRLDCGVPEAGDFGREKMFALDADLDELGGIAFDKGCYVGQELTARMKHRATARKRLLPVRSTGTALPENDAAVMAGETDIGTLMSRYGDRGFASIRLDRLDDSRDTALRIGETAVTVTKPDWLFV